MSLWTDALLRQAEGADRSLRTGETRGRRLDIVPGSGRYTADEDTMIAACHVSCPVDPRDDKTYSSIAVLNDITYDADLEY